MTKRDDSSKQSASDLAKSWRGHSTFRPLRHAEDDDDLDPMGKQAGSGLYGFTKGIQTCVDVGIRKLSKYASKTASALWAKDPKSAEFLTTHVRKAGSMSAKALLAAMADLGPKVDKVASGRIHGLYGFRSKTAKNALAACQAVREEAGYIAHDMYARQAEKYADLLAYMEKHCESTQCPYTNLLMQSLPDQADKTAAMRTAQDSGSGPAHEFFFDDPRRKEVREFARTHAITNVPQVLPGVIKDYDELDEKPSQLKREVAKTPLTPNEVLDETAGSDEFSTLSRFLVMTKTPTSEPVPQSVDDLDSPPDLAKAHKKVTERYLKKLAYGRR